MTMSTSRERRSIAARLSSSCTPDGLLMLHCFLAMLCAAALLTLLGSHFGMVRRSCDDSYEVGYSSCAVRQDIRSVLSFALGAFLCNCFDRGRRYGSRPGRGSRGAPEGDEASSTETGKQMDCLAFIW
mmetsp:Transcript_9407/g.27971  ORF Transcript_9407/g.27971 Transcript_9407/m.27971 type:complete len:128 (+) Transcript_9407:64-447(+)